VKEPSAERPPEKRRTPRKPEEMPDTEQKPKVVKKKRAVKRKPKVVKKEWWPRLIIKNDEGVLDDEVRISSMRLREILSFEGGMEEEHIDACTFYGGRR
jgi:hypothetical protein